MFGWCKSGLIYDTKDKKDFPPMIANEVPSKSGRQGIAKKKKIPGESQASPLLDNYGQAVPLFFFQEFSTFPPLLNCITMNTSLRQSIKHVTFSLAAMRSASRCFSSSFSFSLRSCSSRVTVYFFPKIGPWNPIACA